MSPGHRVFVPFAGVPSVPAALLEEVWPVQSLLVCLGNGCPGRGAVSWLCHSHGVAAGPEQ